MRPMREEREEGGYLYNHPLSSRYLFFSHNDEYLIGIHKYHLSIPLTHKCKNSSLSHVGNV